MKATKVCGQYCIGCGLCHSELKCDMSKNEKGYSYPTFANDADTEEFLGAVCPAMHNVEMQVSGADMWGRRIGVYAGYSNDDVIRRKASSGGVLTEVACYLLDRKKVDGIIQICVNPADPKATIVQISTDREQVLQCCGSRYSISNPWYDLSGIVDKDKRYAAIAKPCDIRALRNLQEHYGKYDNILYLFSFFCAGLPSEDANVRLLQELKCDVKQVASLTYRGNGWPGYATAIDKQGNKYTMDYAKAWGGILGRDINPFCRLCLDGIGEAADIACGDGWYMKEDGTPDFAEREGRNVIFSRTMKGDQLLHEIADAGVIALDDWDNIDYLQAIQNYQYTRRATMRAKMLGYKLMGRSIPRYDRVLLKEYAKYADTKAKLKIFLGTIKRILEKKI